MQRTKLANTNIDVSLLGLGTVKLGRNTGVKYPSAFDLPDDRQALKILNTAADCGINLIDTAPAYGSSEQRLGQLLPKTQHDWVIATKVGEMFDPATGLSSYHFTPEFIQQSIEDSLRTLGRDCLDIVLIHSDGNDQRIIENGALDTLNHLKAKGLIRATGMSTKTVAGGIMAAEQSDIVMVTHNLDYQEERPVIEFAHQHHKGIFIKKALASGHIANTASDSVSQSFENILSIHGVSSIILGSINPGHIQSNAEKAIKAYQKTQT